MLTRAQGQAAWRWNHDGSYMVGDGASRGRAGQRVLDVWWRYSHCMKQIDGRERYSGFFFCLPANLPPLLALAESNLKPVGEGVCEMTLQGPCNMTLHIRAKDMQI